jgi:serine/threonine-protein kinase
MQRLIPARFLAALSSDESGPIELPSDIVREFRRRVRVAAAIGTLAYGMFLAIERVRLLGGSRLERSIDQVHDVLGIVVCGSLWIVASLPGVRDRTVLGLALAAEVGLCALISVAVPWAAYDRTAHLPALTWVVPIIVLFPLLVPAPPTLTLAISLLCGAMMPLGPWLLDRFGVVDARASDLLGTALAGAVGVGIAIVASRTVYGAGRQAAAVRAVGGYELIEPLGQGGMGEVWRARHLLLARPAAVKLILPERLQGPTEERDAVVKRFAREAQVTASLRSPHTVALFDFGVSSDGTLYYAMELLDGMNAEHFVYRFGPLEPRRVVSWLRQACHSLGEAHARGLVHRDIKPANLYVCRRGRDVDIVKILDFGLTRPMLATRELGLTSPGIVLGTPGYMAPEQVFGSATDARADLYALGCVAYWLLAGAKPFESNDAGDLLRQHVQVAPPPLAHKAPAVPARLDALVMACLAKDPNQRPADADRMSAELDECDDGAPWNQADAHAWWERNLPNKT